MVFLIFIAIAILGFLIQFGISRRGRSPQRALDLLLRWTFGVAVGLVGVFNFLGHTFEARQVAEQIGFPPGNPFQWEVAWANLGIGVMGLIAIVRRDFWWPAAIMSATFSWGAAWGHIYQLVVNGNHHPTTPAPFCTPPSCCRCRFCVCWWPTIWSAAEVPESRRTGLDWALSNWDTPAEPLALNRSSLVPPGRRRGRYWRRD
jgi:uncharacterized membrane protein YphA (DoxX/SURF4 family)